ncbi:SARP family transcriptional regulator [Actinocatenispora thailandica]|uniref:SARP family transcriptional regulator n=1 Tax=Actinocatenispora thailandica TaxID=227318 RepID=A0A7R7HV81_9ACTN|nr:BTAD domain-containing putative transcriptional regulator [Actinocatenispora thailandica]BCJ33453.1 SARP family transcriptional regulator [Actinocatenispora thailandica]
MSGPVTVGVLGAVTAWDADGAEIALKGPRHRAVLARLVAARGRSVSLPILVDDLWPAPPANPAGAIRTFVGDLRRALEPDRPPRAAPRVLVTAGAGYALRLPTELLDASRFEAAVRAARTAAPVEAAGTLAVALGWWRGPAYGQFAEEPWARADRARLTELRLQAVELSAGARLALGRAAEVVPDLDAHLADHPWRERAWAMLAEALRDTDRQAEALAVLRRARSMLVDRLGLDPSPALQQLETDILRRSEPAPAGHDDVADRIWLRAASSYRSTPGARTRLRSTVDLLRTLAVTGGPGLVEARAQRLDTIRAAEELGDVELTARVIGGYDVPAIWSRVDDEEQAAEVVAAARRTLARLPAGGPVAHRARLLATIAVESRGGGDPAVRSAAEEAVTLARAAGDPALLAFALNGLFLQSFGRTGLAAERAAIGAELVELAAGRGLTTYELLGHLIGMQAAAGLGDVSAADGHAGAADALARRYESPLVAVFTTWYRALRTAITGAAPDTTVTAYRQAAALLDGAGMPGMRHGLLPLALLSVRRSNGIPAPTGELDWGPYRPWVRPLTLLAAGRTGAAGAALRAVPEPRHDHLAEALWCLVGDAAVQLGDRTVMGGARDALRPAAGELAGAGSGVLTLGPVSDHLSRLSAALAGRR